ncbi:MAG: hypothetical protein H7A51_00480 [Akkermansiaceae bacterium]|nr:hypothetical protein [Akkermansiaceae bacterium]
MKIHNYLLLVIAVFTPALSADTIVLKSGKKYEGRILSQDDTSYLVEVFVTKSIKDERRIPKDHVQEIITQAEDDKEFETIKNLVPTPDRIDADNCEARIKSARDFIAKYPKSKHVKAANTIIGTLEKEYQVISKGGLKLGGQLITSADLEANTYDIHARMLLIDIKHLSARGSYQQALRAWETLQNDYSKSAAYVSSNAIAGRILRAHIAELKKWIKTLDAREATRKSALESLEAGDRERTIALLAEKQQAYNALIEKEEKELRTRWLTIDPYHKKALDYNLRNSESALNSLGAKSSTQTELAGPAFRGAWSALAKGDLEEAAKLIHKLESMHLPAKYTEPLAKQLEEKQATQAAEAQAAKERAEQERLEKIKAEMEAAEKAAKEAGTKKKGRGKRK